MPFAALQTRQLNLVVQCQLPIALSYSVPSFSALSERLFPYLTPVEIFRHRHHLLLAREQCGRVIRTSSRVVLLRQQQRQQQPTSLSIYFSNFAVLLPELDLARHYRHLFRGYFKSLLFPYFAS